MENQVNKNSNQQQPKNALIGVGELLSNAFEDYKNNFSKLIVFILIPIAFNFLFYLIGFVFFEGSFSIDYLHESSFSSYPFMVLWFVSWFGALLLFLFSASCVFIIFRGNNDESTAKSVASQAKNYMVGYLLLIILIGILVLLWSLLLIIPGIIFSIYYTLSVWVFFKEGKKGMAAIKRSHDLVKDYWWAVFGRLVLVGVIFVIISSILEKIGGKSLSGVLSWFFGPFMIVYQYHIYQGLVKIKGGATVENITKETVVEEVAVEETKKPEESVVVEKTEEKPKEEPEVKKENPEAETKKKEMS